MPQNTWKANLLTVLLVLSGCAASTGAPAIPSTAAGGLPSTAAAPASGTEPAAREVADRRRTGAEKGAPSASGPAPEAADEADEETSAAEQQPAAEGDDDELVAGRPAGAAQTSGERRDGLDRKLEDSLSEFDALLLGEKETIAQLRPEAAGAPASGTSAAGRDGGAAGGGGAESEESTAGAEGSAGDAGDAARRGEPAPGGAEAPRSGELSEDGARVADRGKEPGGEEEGIAGRVPPDIPSGEDDDIVARQLREAAMEEDDPELRAKLWEEYRRYRSGQRPPEAETGDGKDES